MSTQSDASPIASATTEHQAKSAGDGLWTVSFLPGRQLTAGQAEAAMAAAYASTTILSAARRIGLTPLEVLGLALMPAPQAHATRHHSTGFRRFFQRAQR